MGRGRGKGKKLTGFTSHEDPGSGDEVLPSYKRRGRPQKHLKEDAENNVGMIDEDGEGEDVKTGILEKEVKGLTTVDNGKKRKRSSQLKENSKLVLDGSGVTVGSNFDNSTRSNGLRQNSSRRKSTPQRAAEAGVK